MGFGERIRALRQDRGFSQRALAEKAGLDFTYLSKIENDRLEHTPSIKTILDLARALEVDELELLDLARKVPSPFEAVAREQEAVRFFRLAAETITGPDGWRDLTRYLERRTALGAEGGSEGSEPRKESDTTA